MSELRISEWSRVLLILYSPSSLAFLGDMMLRYKEYRIKHSLGTAFHLFVVT